ncbi:MAG: RNA polymerase sigma factor, partial [bacterium]
MLKFDLSGHHYEGKKYKNIDYVGAKNDKVEQNKIIETYLPLIKNMSRIQQSIDEDLFQEQMMCVVENVIPSYDNSKGKFSTYLYTLLNNNKLNYIRDNNRRNHMNTLQTVSGKDDDARTLQDILLINEESPENAVLKEFEMEYLVKIINELPERERKIIN